MTFADAMTEAVKMAHQENRKIYLYKISGAGWGMSPIYWKDWLFVAYPGGRKILSPEGTKLLDKERQDAQ